MSRFGHDPVLSPDRCQHMVYGDYRSHQCSRPAVVGGYCKQHDPAAVKARRAIRDAKADAKWGALQRAQANRDRAFARDAAWAELYRVAAGALGYLEALPEASRPDELWLIPLRAAVRDGKAL